MAPLLDRGSRICQTAGQVRIQTLAAELGCSRRYLLTRFRAQVGMAPKAVVRLLRFADVRRRLKHDPTNWAATAHAARYCDQSHLNREFRAPAGTTPSDFISRLIPAGGVVGTDASPPAAEYVEYEASRRMGLATPSHSPDHQRTFGTLH